MGGPLVSILILAVTICPGIFLAKKAKSNFFVSSIIVMPVWAIALGLSAIHQAVFAAIALLDCILIFLFWDDKPQPHPKAESSRKKKNIHNAKQEVLSSNNKPVFLKKMDIEDIQPLEITENEFTSPKEPTIDDIVFDFLGRASNSTFRFLGKTLSPLLKLLKKFSSFLFELLGKLLLLALWLSVIALPFVVLFIIGARGMGAPGRPFRSSGKFLKPTAEKRSDWLASLPIYIENLTSETRQKLSTAWLEIAAAEHASVATFSKLSLQLMTLGAPPELLKACQQAAMDEIEHARCCYSFASTYAEQTFGPSPFTQLNGIQLEKITLEQLAIESLQDGCLMEGDFSDALYAAAELAIDPVLKTNLIKMAEDEARHAELAWEILDWSLKASIEMKEKIQTITVDLPKVLQIKHYDELALVTLEQHGFLARKKQDEIYYKMLNSVKQRVTEYFI